MIPVFIAGHCVIETENILQEVDSEIVRINQKYNISIIFKSSFDKANMAFGNSYC